MERRRPRQCGLVEVWARARVNFPFPSERDNGLREWTPGCGWPSPAEIAEKCAEIQATWTEAEWAKRCCYPEHEVETPVVAERSLAI